MHIYFPRYLQKYERKNVILEIFDANFLKETFFDSHL